MEFGEKLKNELHQVPGHGFTEQLKQNVLRTIDELPPARRKHHRSRRMWGTWSAAAAMVIVIGTGYELYQHGNARQSTGPTAPSYSHDGANGPVARGSISQSPLKGLTSSSASASTNATSSSTIEHSTPVVSPAGGLGDILKTIQSKHGVGVRGGSTEQGTVVYTFPKENLTVTLDGGRAVAVEKTFTQAGMKQQPMQVFSELIPTNTTYIKQSTTGNVRTYVYTDDLLAQVLPSTAFGSAKPGTFSVQVTTSANQAVYKAVLGDALSSTWPISRLTLPTGQVLTSDQTGAVTWNGLTIQLQALGTATGDARGAMDNHSTVVETSTVAVNGEKATLALEDQTSPAASGSTTHTYKWWVILLRPNPRGNGDIAYAITATFTGDAQAAKQKVMELVKQWVVPKAN